MRAIGIILLAVLFLVGCGPTQTERKAARSEVDRTDPATVLTVERLDFPKHGGSAADALQFEVEFSDGTKAGCIHIWTGLSCVKLGSV